VRVLVGGLRGKKKPSTRGPWLRRQIKLETTNPGSSSNYLEGGGEEGKEKPLVARILGITREWLAGRGKMGIGETPTRAPRIKFGNYSLLLEGKVAGLQRLV